MKIVAACLSYIAPHQLEVSVYVLIQPAYLQFVIFNIETDFSCLKF